MIEDIEYLKNNCENDASIVYIDSSNRDRRYFPNPAEYTVDFEQPFKLVTGFDILDASIPTTMWNIDLYNGTLAITSVVLPNSFNEDVNAGETYFTEIENSVLFSRLFERGHISGSLNENFVYIVSDTWYSNLQQTILPSETLTPYFMFIRREIEDAAIKIAPKVIDESLYYIFIFNAVVYFVDKENTDLIEKIEKGDYYVYEITENVYNFVYFEEVNITEVVYESIGISDSFLARINNFYKQIDLGNYDITTLKTELNRIWNRSDIYFDSTTVPDRKQGIYKVRSGYYVVVNAKIGKLIKQLGFDTLPSIVENTKYAVKKTRNNYEVFGAIYNETSERFIVEAPGIVNLLGERYLILRCKEIEDHLLGSYGYMKYTPGLGVFKLAANYNDVTNLRFDFVNLVRKPFHPIGKLSKLSVRFETQDGELYDFKGINHQLLFVIRYLTPTQKMSFSKSLLNPNYDANYMRYMSNNKTIEYKEDSDDEQDFMTKTNQQHYKKEVEKYDYSTSGSDDDTDDSEVEFDFSRGKAPSIKGPLPLR
jgi:hypothetical protein